MVGPAYAREIFYTGRQFDTDEALRMGLVNRVVSSDELETTVSQLAATIGGNAPLTVRAAKEIVREALKDEGSATWSCAAGSSPTASPARITSRADRFYGKAPSGVQGPVMKLPAHGRYDYVPIPKRPVYDWPEGKRLAVFFCNNIEFFAFGSGLGSDSDRARRRRRTSAIMPGATTATASGCGAISICSTNTGCPARITSTRRCWRPARRSSNG